MSENRGAEVGCLADEYDVYDAAYTAVTNGHNCCVLGQPGTGKTRFLMKLSDDLTIRGKTVNKTASTGIAAANIAGTTIHKFCGIRDGSESVNQIVARLRDGSQALNLERLLICDVILIDEVSMISAHILEVISAVLQQLRQSQKAFGGIQVVVFGDFYQLKPVPGPCDPGFSLLHSDKVEKFTRLFPHKYELKKVYRQNADSEGDLIHTIHSLCRGMIDERVKRTVNGMSHSGGEGAIKLFARNFDVDYTNSQGLRMHEGNMHIYDSEDQGDRKRLKGYGMPAPKRLHLKTGCPVVLIINISDTLVNGRRGTVIQLTPKCVTVKFDKGEVKDIDKRVFTLSDNSGKQVAWRKQVPLRLAYAFTVHKAQGMTLEDVTIDATDMRIPGQLGVALGRAKKSKGVTLINFKEDLIKPQPAYIPAFYKQQSKELCDKISCCQGEIAPTNSYNQQNVQQSVPYSYDDQESEDDDESDCADHLQALDTLTMSTLAHLKYSECLTPMQEQLNECILYLTDPSTSDARQTFIHKEWKVLTRLCEAFSLPELTSKNATAIYHAIQAHLSSQKYMGHVTKLLLPLKTVPEATKFRVCYAIVEQLRKEKVRVSLDSIKIPTGAVSPGTAPADHHSDAVIRYISGWCVNKLMKSKRAVAQRNLFNDKSVLLVELARSDLDTLKSLLTNEIDDTDDSMTEIIRKQYFTGALKVVCTDAFIFFKALDATIRSKETNDNCTKYGPDLYIHISESIMNDSDLISQWSGITGTEIDNKDLYGEVVAKFITMSASHYIKVIKDKHQVKKRFQLRKQVHVATSQTYKPLQPSTQPQPSKPSQTSKQPQLSKPSQSLEPPQPSENLPSTSGIASRRKQKTRSSTTAKRERKVLYPCAICQKECKDGTVFCETCSFWHHYRCVGLKGDEPELHEDAPDWMCSRCNSK